MIRTEIKGIPLAFETDASLFSPNSVDAGTLAMLKTADFLPDDKILDLGCGYGVVGIFAAKIIGGSNVVMCDQSETAVQYAKKNAERNGVSDVEIKISDAYENIPDRDFTCILSNPPYHADFSVARKFIEGGYQRLSVGGRMCMVTKRLVWYKKKLSSVFGGVRVYETDGYYVFIAEKRKKKGNGKPCARKKLSKKLRRKYGGSLNHL